MAKALKIAGAVIGGAALIVFTAGAGAGLLAGLSLTGAIGAATAGVAGTLGLSLGGLLALSAGLTAASSLLGNHAPPVTSSQTDRLTATIDPRAFRKSVYGSTALATDVRYEEWFGAAQEYCGWIVALASHRIQSVLEIWLNDELAWSAASGVQAKFVGYFYVQAIVLEGSPANTVVISNPNAGKWNTAHRLTGCAYAHLQFRVTGVNKKAESPFSGGIPNRMTIIGEGGLLYDPRRDSTVQGGSGPMRAGDQSTWRYHTDDGADIGENLPLQVLRELLGWRITNPVSGAKKLAVGGGIPPARLDLASWIVAANLADELVGRSAGGTEPRYHGAGVLSEGDDPRTRFNMLLAGCSGRLTDAGGRLGIAVAHNDLAAAASDDGLTTDDVVGGFTWDPDPALEQTPNVVRGRYVDASSASLYQLIDYPEVRVSSPDGIDRFMSLDVGAVESASQAQRIAKQALQRKQYLRQFTAPFDIRAWSWPVGSIVPFTFAPLGFVRRLFRVAEQEVGEAGVCNMTLREESAAIYAWDARDAPPVQAAAAIVYDPTKAPLVQAIDQSLAALSQTGVANSFAVGMTLVAAAAGTITIGNHVRRSTDGHADVAVTGSTVTGLSPAAGYFVAYDDPDRTGGAVTFSVYATAEEAGPSPTHPARHFLDYVEVPAEGQPDTGSGGGGGPPWWKQVSPTDPGL